MRGILAHVFLFTIHKRLWITHLYPPILKIHIHLFSVFNLGTLEYVGKMKLLQKSLWKNGIKVHFDRNNF